MFAEASSSDDEVPLTLVRVQLACEELEPKPLIVWWDRTQPLAPLLAFARKYFRLDADGSASSGGVALSADTAPSELALVGDSVKVALAQPAGSDSRAESIDDLLVGAKVAVLWDAKYLTGVVADARRVIMRSNSTGLEHQVLYDVQGDTYWHDFDEAKYSIRALPQGGKAAGAAGGKRRRAALPVRKGGALAGTARAGGTATAAAAALPAAAEHAAGSELGKVEATEEAAEAALACPHCGRVCRSAAGLAKHQAACERQAGEQEYLVERLLGARNRRGKKEYLVRWEGWSEDHDSWEAAGDINEELIEEFVAAQRAAKAAAKAGAAGEGAGGEVVDLTAEDSDDEVPLAKRSRGAGSCGGARPRSVPACPPRLRKPGRQVGEVGEVGEVSLALLNCDEAGFRGEADRAALMAMAEARRRPLLTSARGEAYFTAARTFPTG